MAPFSIEIRAARVLIEFRGHVSWCLDVGFFGNMNVFLVNSSETSSVQN